MSEELGGRYLDAVTDLMHRIHDTQGDAIDAAAHLLADQVAADKLIHVYAPGGHSNLAAQEIFFRAGGLMHVSAILDSGTMLSDGALRSMAVERLPGYGRVVIDHAGLGAGDLLILVNSYGINAALIDAALTARDKGVTTIGLSSRSHADQTSTEHPARHPSKKNLHDVVDLHIDTFVPVGDAVIQVGHAVERSGPVSTFANAYSLNWLMLATIAVLDGRGLEVPIWRSGNAPGGDEANARFLDRFHGRVKWL